MFEFLASGPLEAAPTNKVAQPFGPVVLLDTMIS